MAFVRAAAEAERRWFYGGGIHTWLAAPEDTGGAYLLIHDELEGGKATPLHVHPDSDESFYVLAGEITVHVDGTDHYVKAGGIAMAARGVAHAFLVTSPTAELLYLHTPGACAAFYREASEPLGDERKVDFDRVRAAAMTDPGIELLGPPPFAQP
ncbi:MAG: cupin domain-containing protein [Actinomycetota bacterium]|nr:cupin domain-containing protein [Actinomycetota bacterium]